MDMFEKPVVWISGVEFRFHPWFHFSGTGDDANIVRTSRIVSVTPERGIIETEEVVYLLKKVTHSRMVALKMAAEYLNSPLNNEEVL
jgi:hypothetical protein